MRAASAMRAALVLGWLISLPAVATVVGRSACSVAAKLLQAPALRHGGVAGALAARPTPVPLTFSQALALRGGGVVGALAARPTPTPLVASLAVVTALFLALHALLLRMIPALVGRKRWSSLPAPNRHLVVHETVTSLLATPLLLTLYLRGLAELVQQGALDLEAEVGLLLRWQGSNVHTHWALVVHVAMNLYDVLYAYPKDKSKTAPYFVHHLLTLLVFVPVLLRQRLQFFAVTASLIEATNPFVGVCQNIIRLELLSDDEARWDWHTINLVSGALLIVSWFVLRLLMLPAMSFVFLREWRRYFALPAEVAAAAGGLGRMGEALLGAASQFACAAIWVLSCVWFREIVRSALAVVAAKDDPSPGRR